jgi:hypothetical protein
LNNVLRYIDGVIKIKVISVTVQTLVPTLVECDRVFGVSKGEGICIFRDRSKTFPVKTSVSLDHHSLWTDMRESGFGMVPKNTPPGLR